MRSAEFSNGSSFGVFEISLRFFVPADSPISSCAPESSKPRTAAALMQLSESDQPANQSLETAAVNPVSAQASGWAEAAAGSSANAATDAIAAIK